MRRVFKKWTKKSTYVAQVGLISSIVVVDVVVAVLDVLAMVVAVERNLHNCSMNILKPII